MRPCTAPPIGDDDRYFATRFHRSRVYPRSARMMAQVRKSTSPANAFASKERPMDYRDRHVVVNGGSGRGGTPLAEEVVKAGILVNAVGPSTMDAPANRKAMPKADHDAWAKVEDVAAAILFLCSPENRVTRGAVMPVYGRT